MKLIIKKILLLCALTSAYTAKSQEVWPSPEIKQMNDHAGEFMEMGDFTDAIVTYRQAIALAPDKIVLYKGLGKAFYLSGKYKEAEETITPLLTRPQADDQCYELLAASQATQKKMPEARATIKRGLAYFPSSGPLYHASGMVYNLEKDKENALKAWLDGIALAPAYAANYYDASLLYLATDHVTWGLIYAETYLAMNHDTTMDDTIKSKLYEGYKTFFRHVAGENVPQYGKVTTTGKQSSFETAMTQVYAQLTPVVSDGVTTENLAMVRTRFIMGWLAVWGKQYPFALFSYEDQLLRNGYFDKYNEWLFGKAQSVTEYNAWNEFHTDDIADFTEWWQEHPLVPVAKEFYNDRQTTMVK